MSGFRIFWAVLLAFCVAFLFFREWNYERQAAEHGVVLKKHPGRETVIWLSPLMLPLFFALLAAMLLVTAGPELTGEVLLQWTGELVILLTLYYGVLLAILPLLRRLFSARCCATLWLLPVFLYWLPHVWRDAWVEPRLVLYVPERVLSLLGWLWLAGFLLVMAVHILSHLRFRRRVLAGAYPAMGRELLELWEREQRLIERKHPIPLKISPAIASPMTVGLFRHTTVTLLPPGDYSREELTFIFRHELRHVQRRDVDTKVFFAFCRGLCWFNPLMWAAVKKASADLELSCDEMVLWGRTEEERKGYAALLLDTAGDSRGFTTCLSASARTLRYRLQNVVRERKRLPGGVLLAGVMGALVLSAGAVTVSDCRGPLGEAALAGHTETVISSLQTESRGEGYRPVYGWDEEKLMDYVTSLPVTRLARGSYQVKSGENSLFLQLDSREGFVWLDLTDGILEVFSKGERGESTLWKVDREVDWDLVRSCLDYDAPDPDPGPVRPELMLWFGPGLDFDEPIYAASNLLQKNTPGEEHRYERESVGWGGLHNFPVSWVELEFSYPAEWWSVTVAGLDGEEPYTLEGWDEAGGRLELAPYSARYTLSGMFSSHQNTDYHMEFYFEVVLPEE